MAEFWKNLESLMEAESLTQTDLANELGISKTTVSNWRGGVIPKADTAVEIARVLGVSVEFLITGTDTAEDGLSREAKSVAARISILPDSLKAIVMSTLEACERQCVPSSGQKEASAAS